MTTLAPLYPDLLVALLLLGAFGYCWGANLDRVQRWVDR